MWKRSHLFILLAACSSPPEVLVTHTTGTLALDAPLELHFVDGVDASVLDGLVLMHDGIRETGKVTAEANVARFWPDHGWYAGTTYEATLDGVVDEAGDAVPPWTFASHGSWRAIGGIAPGCGANDWNPQVTTTLDGAAWLVGHAGGRTCVTQLTAEGWQPVTLLGTATRAGDTIFPSTLHLADDGAGFAIHTVNERSEIIDVGGTVLGTIDALDDFRPPPAAAMSPGGHGIVMWKRHAPSLADQALFARRYDAGVLGEPTMIAQARLDPIGAAVNDAGVRAVAWIEYLSSGGTRLMLAVDRGDGAWQPHQVKALAPNTLGQVKLAIDDAGWAYLAWLEVAGPVMQVWAAAESADARRPQARIDGNNARVLRTNLALSSRFGHTRAAWLEKTEENRLGVVATRPATAGVWAPSEDSTTDVHPYLDLAMAIDGLGNPAFTWKDGQLTPCGARKAGTVWTELCDLPRPNFTAPSPGIAVNARGRAFVSFYTGTGVGVATFD